MRQGFCRGHYALLGQMKIIDNSILDTGYDKFNSLEILNRNLAEASVESLAKDTCKEHVFDFSLGRRMDRGTFLAASLAIRDVVAKIPEDRIGIALPAGIPGFLVNLAVQMAGKVSVNLNFTMGSDAARACLRRAKIKTIIGSDKIRQRVNSHFPDYPWSDNFIDVGGLLKSLGRAKIARNLLLVRALPGRILCRIFGIPSEGGNREASIIFTSGSEGEPKAAVLTHRNLMANSVQMSQLGIITPDTVIHANLPLFHSFGQTIQLWLATIFGVRSVAVQSPLEIQANIEAARAGGSTLMISTPTFLRSYYKKAKSSDFPKMRLVIGGAEKTPDGFIDQWEGKFKHIRYFEGYGLTEASPVVGVNLFENMPRPPRGEFYPQPSGCKHGSIGEMFCGMQAKVVDPDTGETLKIGERGILCLRSATVFGGYLDMPEANKERVSPDGWLNTGDIAVLDTQGYIYIKGRLSRFSKIGGEMVPHMGVEEAVVQAMGLQESEQPIVAVGSRIDGAKGEALVLLSTIDIDMPQLRRLLTEAGLPNLWIPKHVLRVESIPILGSGKLDLGKIRKLCADFSE